MKLVGGLGVEGAVTQLASDVIHHSIPSVHEASVEATEKGLIVWVSRSDAAFFEQPKIAFALLSRLPCAHDHIAAIPYWRWQVFDLLGHLFGMTNGVELFQAHLTRLLARSSVGPLAGKD